MPDTWANTSLLRFRRERAVATFSELAQCGHELFAFMGVYADRLPWCSYDRQAQQNYLAFLRELKLERPKFLTDFMRDEHGTIEIAFRTLETINRTFPHDRDWFKLEDAELLRTIHHEAHPTYLQLCEGVLKWFLTIAAVPLREKRGTPTDRMSPNDLAQEARNAGIHPLACFDSTMRNAIAHGSIAFGTDRIEYLNRDRGKTRTRVNKPHETLAMVEALLDVCNGMAAALRLYVLLDRELLFSKSAPVPPALVFPEVDTQLATIGWRVDDYLELREEDGTRQLTLFARCTYIDDHKTRLSVVRTATFAAALMPGFDRYLVELHRRGERAGWGRFDGAKVRELMAQGVEHAPTYVEHATQLGDFIVFPALGRFNVPSRLRIFGSIAEVIRTSWAARNAERQIEVRHVEMQSKRSYAFANAHVVLHRSDLAAAVMLTTKNVRRIVRMAIRAARALPHTSWWLRHLPAGYVQVWVYLEDRRRRELLSDGWGPNLLCRLTRKTRGRIPVGAPPEAMAEMVAGIRVDWNGPVIEPLLQNLRAAEKPDD
jgi:hypothetical protein